VNTCPFILRELGEVKHSLGRLFTINEVLNDTVLWNAYDSDVVPLVVVNVVTCIFDVSYPASVKVKDTIADPQGLGTFIKRRSFIREKSS
jgi:hypothetical protein